MRSPPNPETWPDRNGSPLKGVRIPSKANQAGFLQGLQERIQERLASGWQTHPTTEVPVWGEMKIQSGKKGADPSYCAGS